MDSMGAVSTAPPIDFQKYILIVMTEENFYTFDFHDFYLKVKLLSVLQNI